jgi:hypothetical protein
MSDERVEAVEFDVWYRRKCFIDERFRNVNKELLRTVWDAAINQCIRMLENGRPVEATAVKSKTQLAREKHREASRNHYRRNHSIPIDAPVQAGGKPREDGE